jgi:predicted nucleotidyltransferase
MIDPVNSLLTYFDTSSYLCNHRKNTMTAIENHTADIFKLCETHNVKSLYAFGSVLTNHYKSNSDIDLIVDFKPLNVLEYADNYFALKFALQDIFKRPVDLLEAKALKNPYFNESINQQRQLIYEQ